MPSVGSHSDGLRLLLAGSEVLSLRTVGAIAGVVVLAAAGRNGPGVGSIIASAGGVSWQAPGSSIAGPVTPIPGDGQYLLEDGSDPSCWLRIQAYVASLATSGAAQVFLNDLYNSLRPNDVTAANAAAGHVDITQYSLSNVTTAAATNVTAWLDPATVSAGLAISSDGINFFQPIAQTDATALTWASIAPGSSVNLWTQRTITAGAMSNPVITNIIRLSWNGV